jgi:hypothetical protein
MLQKQIENKQRTCRITKYDDVLRTNADLGIFTLQFI